MGRLPLSITKKVETGCGTIVISLYIDKKGKVELTIKLGKTGGCPSAWGEAFATALSIALADKAIDQLPNELDMIAKAIGGHQCSSKTFSDGEEILSCSDAISKALTAIAGSDWLKDHVKEYKDNHKK